MPPAVPAAYAGLPMVNEISIAIPAVKATILIRLPCSAARGEGSGAVMSMGTKRVGDSSLAGTPRLAERRGFERPPFAPVRL